MHGLCRTRLALAAVLAAMAPPAGADDWTFGGHLKYLFTYTDYRATDLAAVVGPDPARDHGLDARLKAEWRARGFEFSAHYEVLAAAGDSVETRRALSRFGVSAGGLPDDRQRLFDLTDDFIDENRAHAVHRLDRLAVGYIGGNGTLRLGRQAVSWGNGLAFQVLDFVNPFSPIAIDKDYKTGEDMLYGQWLWNGAGDLQGMVLPRRDPSTRDLDPERASYAVKWHGRAAEFDYDLLAARHYDQSLLGMGAVRSVGGAVWRGDVLYTDVTRRAGVWSLVTNIDWSWMLFGRNMYGFAEYFRNGFGVDRDAGYRTLDPELVARVARGELYALGRDNAVLGLQAELAPLLNAFATVVQNLNDGSRVVQLRAAWDVYQNLMLVGGVMVPSGPRSTEYGGVPAPVSGTYLAGGRTVFLRAGYYF